MCLFVCLSACLSVCLFVCLFDFIWFYLFVSVCGPTKLWKLWHLVMFFSWLHGFLACAVVSVGIFEDFCDNAGYSLLLWHQFCVYQVFIRIARHFHYRHGPDVIPDVTRCDHVIRFLYCNQRYLLPYSPRIQPFSSCNQNDQNALSNTKEDFRPAVYKCVSHV